MHVCCYRHKTIQTKIKTAVFDICSTDVERRDKTIDLDRAHEARTQFFTVMMLERMTPTIALHFRTIFYEELK